MKRKADNMDEPEPKPVKSAPTESTMTAAAGKGVAAKRVKTKTPRDDGTTNEDLEDADVVPPPTSSSPVSLVTNPEPVGSIFGGASATPLRKRVANVIDEPAASKRIKIDHETADVDMELTPLIREPGSAISVESQQSTRKPLTFLSLPPEIRLRIYDYLFGDLQPICLPFKCTIRGKKRDANGVSIFKDSPRWGFRKGVLTAMARANKQLSQELLHFVYSTRGFMLTVPQHRSWITQIGHSNSSTIQNIILSCKGRAKTAGGNLFSTLATLRKRGFESLKYLTLYDNGLSVDSSFLVRQLLLFGETQGWKQFHQLELLSFNFPHPHPPRADTPLYENLCLQSRAIVSSKIFRAAPAVGPTPPIQRRIERWLRLDPIELEKRLKEEREAKKKAASLKKEAMIEAKQDKIKAKKERWLQKRTDALATTFDEVQRQYQGSASTKSEQDA